MCVYIVILAMIGWLATSIVLGLFLGLVFKKGRML